jgi:hypothetical protein
VTTNSLRVGLLTPVYSTTESLFTLSVACMVSHFLSTKWEGPDGEPIKPALIPIQIQGSGLCENRHALLAAALREECDWALWLDADHVFPPDALNRLLARGRSLIGCNYARRCIPTAPVAACVDVEGRRTGDLLYTTKEKADADLVEECAHTGLGLFLMNMGVVATLQEHADSIGERMMPLFQINSQKPGENSMVGEDAFFFAKCRAAGLKVWIDHALSWDVGHVHQTILYNWHADRQREQFRDLVKGNRERLLCGLDPDDPAAPSPRALQQAAIF